MLSIRFVGLGAANKVVTFGYLDHTGMEVYKLRTCWPFLQPSLHLPLFLLSATPITANEAINYDSSGWRSSYGKPRSASIYIYNNDDQDSISQKNNVAPVVALFAGDEIEKSLRASLGDLAVNPCEQWEGTILDAFEGVRQATDIDSLRLAYRHTLMFIGMKDRRKNAGLQMMVNNLLL